MWRKVKFNIQQKIKGILYENLRTFMTELFTSVTVLVFVTWFTSIYVVAVVTVTIVISVVTKFTINMNLLVKVFNFVTKRTNIAVVTLVTNGPWSLRLLERAGSVALCGRFLSCYRQFYPVSPETFCGSSKGQRTMCSISVTRHV
jgi:hypothetical protein